MNRLRWLPILPACLLSLVFAPVTFVATDILPSWLGLQNISFEALLIVILGLNAGLSGFMFGSLAASQHHILRGVTMAGLTIPATYLLAFMLYHLLFPPSPSDWWLIWRFERNETVFTELREAVQGEGEFEEIYLERVLSSDVRAAGISSAKLGEYRAKMSQLGLVSVREHGSTPENVTFGVKQNGFFISKEYVYLQELPTRVQIVKKIKDKDVETFGEVYRALGNGWYLYAYEISG